MKHIIIYLVLIVYMPLYGNPPLVDVATDELILSKQFLRYERYQQRDLYAYTKLLKVRYVLTKEEEWVSNKILDAIYLQSSMISVMKEK